MTDTSPLAPSLPSGDDVVVIRPGAGLARLGLPQVWEYRHLLQHFVLRTVRAKYRPTFFGRFWLLLQPCLLSLVYWVMFDRIVHADFGPIPSPVFIFSGIAVYLFFGNAVRGTSNSLAGNLGTFSKVYYPRLIAPLTAAASAAVDLAGALVILAALMAWFGVAPGWQVVAAPAFLLAIMVFTLGLGLLVAATAVTHRDVQISLPIFLRTMMYASPIMYSATMIPEAWRGLYFANPLAALLQGFRWSLLGDTPPPTWSVASACAVSALLLLAGLVRFNKVEGVLVDSL